MPLRRLSHTALHSKSLRGYSVVTTMREAENEVFDQTIGDIARASEADAGTVRDYANLGLIECKRLSNGTRLFSAGAAAQVRRVLLERLANKGRRRA
jgi:hypothetical protein